MTARTSAAGLRALQGAIEQAGDEQIVRIVDLVDALDRQDAETILAPIRARLRVLRLERPLRLSRLFGVPLEPVLVDGGRWRPSSAALPRSALQPLCDTVASREPALMARVQPLIAGVNTREAGRVHAAGKVFWPGAAASLKVTGDPPESWAKAGLPSDSFPHLAGAASVCLAQALPLAALGDPTTNPADLDLSLSAMLREALAVSPVAWSMLVVLMFCGLPQAQAPRDAVFNQGTTDLRHAADAALAQIWSWVEAAGLAAPRNLNEAAASLRQRSAVLTALAASRGQRPRAAAQQADLRAAYTQYLAEAARDRLIQPLTGLIDSPSDAVMIGMEDHARGLRRMLIEIRGLGGAPLDAEPLHEPVRAACDCTVMRPIDRARLIECLGFPQAAAKLLENVLD